MSPMDYRDERPDERPRWYRNPVTWVLVVAVAVELALVAWAAWRG
jgi:hypothetical protein